MKELHNFAILLSYLYTDEIRYVEEIAAVERMYLYPDVTVFLEDYGNPARFLLIRRNLAGSYSVFLEADGDEVFVLQAMRKIKELPKAHVQTGTFEKDLMAREIPFKNPYEYCIMTFDPDRFHPVFEPTPARLTPDLPVEDLNELSDGNPDRYREEIRYGVLYGFKERDSWVALAGTCARSRNCDYIFVETDAPYRGKGYAKSMLSHVIRDLMKEGRTPVYALDVANGPSMTLGERMGFVVYRKLHCLYVGEWTSSRGAFDSESLPESSFLS